MVRASAFAAAIVSVLLVGHETHGETTAPAGASVSLPYRPTAGQIWLVEIERTKTIADRGITTTESGKISGRYELIGNREGGYSSAWTITELSSGPVPLYNWTTVSALHGMRVEFDTDIQGSPVALKNWPVVRDIVEKQLLTLPKYANRQAAQNTIHKFFSALTPETAVPYFLQELDITAGCQNTDLPIGREITSTDTTQNQAGEPFANSRTNLLIGIDQVARTATLKRRLISDATNVSGVLVDVVEKLNPETGKMEKQTVRTDAAVHQSNTADCTVDIDNGVTRHVLYEERLEVAGQDRTKVFDDIWNITVTLAAK
ncbi:hypothetical protein [Mesorhizobium neociceri]|uniref:Uncharacterized protein n=1 Tax=Mesorhizobium neociceri TaxID=1307853 RepID=A0A838BFB1_9HYPH|nr:hypothetical protein [Mesorhizobium neociceri]MBA1145175.1 hypothetical protein [Mesorhizobium neociceri]